MSRRLIIHARAALDMRIYYGRLVERAPVDVERWFDRLQDTIQSLETNADMWPLAPESKRLKLPIRQLLFGRKPYKFRVYYYIESEVVHVVRVLRCQRRGLRPGDLIELD